MKKWAKILVTIGIGGSFLTSAGPVFATTADDAIAGDIQTIQQASDPSAAISAFANGIATDRNNPKVYAAYVSKMVELGLPEMAYHQAQTLTSMQSNNGLAWGVVAYVDARRGEMPDAISAIVLAGQFAPDNAFVQRTAGELTAWYDLKADKTTLSDSTKDAMTKIRLVLKNHQAFADAYNNATKAYQTSSTTQPAPVPSSTAPGATTAPPESYGTQPQDYTQPSGYDYGTAAPPFPYPDYYPDYGYYSGWGPGWVAPAAWWWWPVGFFGGCSFFPFSTAIVFNHNHFHFHDGHFHSKDGFVAHGGSFHGTHNGGKFFGGSSGPKFAARTAGSSGFHSGIDTRTANTTATRTRSLSMNSSPMIDSRTANTTATRSRSFSAPTTTMNRGFATGTRSPSIANGRSWTTATPRMGTTPSFGGRTWNSQQFSSGRTWNSPAFANRAWSSPNFSSRAWAPQGGRSFSTPAFAPRSGGFAFNGGGFHGGGMGGGFHGGGMGGGGFHGGGGGGGGHGGGGGGGHR